MSKRALSTVIHAHPSRLGAGGRNSVTGSTVTVFGSTGFLGRYLVNQLGKEGNQVVTAYRGDDDTKRHMKVMGDLGQIVPLRFHLEDKATIRECVRNSDVVFNLVGRDYPTRNFSFEKVHVQGASNIAEACSAEGVPSLIHLSALGAQESSHSDFLRTKAIGEAAVRDAFPRATIVRPGWIYGFEDRFLNMLGSLTSEWPRKFLLGRHPVSDAEVKPIYVGDVARALQKMLKQDHLAGKTIELYGSQKMSWDEMSKVFCDFTYRDYKPLHLDSKWLKLATKVWQYYPHSFITPQLIERMYISDKTQDSALTMEDLGLKATQLEEVAIRFLRFYRSADTFALPAKKSEVKLYQKTHPELYT